MLLICKRSAPHISEVYYEISPHNGQIKLHVFLLWLCFQMEQNNILWER